MFTPLATKLHAPPPRRNAVARPRLTERLATRPITLISAQAGSGKSTLLSDWAARSSRPIAWLSLDADDNDPVRFWSYLVTALQRAGVNAGQTLLQTLQAGSATTLQPLLIELLNDLEIAVRPNGADLCADRRRHPGSRRCSTRSRFHDHRLHCGWVLLARRSVDSAAPPLVVDLRRRNEHAGLALLLPDVSEPADRDLLTWRTGDQDSAVAVGSEPDRPHHHGLAFTSGTSFECGSPHGWQNWTSRV